jgi:hypothetical protein
MRNLVWLTSLALSVGLATTTNSAAKPVEYVKVCTLYGAGWAYIPATDTCVNFDTGEIRQQTSVGLVRGLTTLATRVGTLEGQVGDLYGQTAALQSAQQAVQARFDADFRNANDGSAIAMALDSPYLTGSEHFGVKVDWGGYMGSNALGASFAGVLAETAKSRVTLSGGVAFTGSNVGGRAGLQFAW